MASKGQGQVIENLHGLFFVHFDGFNFYRYNTVGKGDELPIIPAVNRRQWVRKDLGAH